jgi:chemotaxis protein CheD
MGERIVTVRIAEMKVVRDDSNDRLLLKTTLGSCVGVILSDAVKGIHGLAHILLPERLGADAALGKYADTAVPALAEEMERAGSSRANLEAFLVGGASMFQRPPGPGLPQVGERNVEVTLRVLKRLGIPVVFQETGGTCGRTVVFDGAERKPRIKTLNGSAQP